MPIKSDEKELNKCITNITQLIEKCLKKFQLLHKQRHAPSKSDTINDDLLQNILLNNNIYIFTLHHEETELLRSLTSDIEDILDEHLRKLSKEEQNYLLDFLHTYQYDRESRKFFSSLSIGVLNLFNFELKGLLASLDAYPAAFNGELDVVKNFINNYPTFKDKPGLWETTLLYSAARNNHFHIVQYLIEEAHCSVNAQNLRDVDFALNASLTTYAPKPTAGSTPLHGACYNNHLNMVKYLVEHGADYFIQNQAIETPINNGVRHPDIKKFFQDYLIMGYSTADLEYIPDRTIMNDNRRPIQDALWEYKPFQDPKWYKFSTGEMQLLQNALLPSEEFQQQIYLKVTKGLYSVSMIEFLRSGRYEQDPQKNMAWVRCRGSSVLNFDCYSIWQIMLIQHKNVDKDTDNTPSLKIQKFPVIFNSAFKLQLNAWYSCDDKTSSSLENAMNHRQKVISIDIPHVGDKLTFNLQTFEFSDTDKTIFGYIRWIPKLISNTESQDQKLVYVDNYELVANIEPTPLTTKRLKEALKTKNVVQRQMNDIENYDDEDDSSLLFRSMLTTKKQDEVDDILSKFKKKSQSSYINIGTWSIDELNEEIKASKHTLKMKAATTENLIVSEDTKISLQSFVQEMKNEIKDPIIVDRVNNTLKSETITTLITQLESEIKELANQIQKEAPKQNKELLDELQQQSHYKTNVVNRLKSSADEIIAIDYDSIESMIANIFLFGKSRSTMDYLRMKLSKYINIEGIPSVFITENNEVYCISVVGIREHQEEFKNVLKRIQNLWSTTKLAKMYYEMVLRRKQETLVAMMTQLNIPLQSWKYYTKCFEQLIKDKIEEFVKLYDEYILNKSKLLVDNCIKDFNFQSLNQLEKLTEIYMKKKQFLPEIEILKSEALDHYVKQHILLQNIESENRPSKKSVEILTEFIKKTKAQFKNNPNYIGCSLEQLKEITKLLQRIMLHFRCFLLQLPLYELSKDLLEKIEQNTVTTISTTSGSGKSTLLPALLIAEGYEKVIVTQPRQLLCSLMCQRVNTTMKTNTDEFQLAGWAAGDDHCNTNAQILYLTDDLLKERLLYDKYFITSQSKNDKPIVFLLDEVHERSVNIDLCLALFARLLKENPGLGSKIKIIISSATLEPSVSKLFLRIPQLKVDEFNMPKLKTLHSITKIERPNQNILDLVQELCKKRQRDDQIVCFVSSVAEANQCCQLLQEVSHGTMIAFPLVPNQSAADQQRFIEQGNIFFSATVAETSLTFPSLAYIIDTGMINVPIYDCKTKQTTLMEIRAAESTLKQRVGRLGRTKPGEYYSLYDFKAEDKTYPKPEICQSDLVNIEFALRKSLVKNGLNYMKEFLLDPPEPEAINIAVKELERLNIITSQENLTAVGIEIATLPDFGSLAMSKSVLSALDNNCGRDLIVLAAILSVLNTSSILKAIPSIMKKSEGDFMTLLNVMNEILLVRKSVPAQQFKLSKIYEAKNLTAISHVLKRALTRYITLEKSFNASNSYRLKAQISSDNWELIAKSLLCGYQENVFVSMKELQGKTHVFTRYSPTREDVAVLDHQSTLSREITSSPVSLVLARDIRFSSSIRATAVLSFVGEIKSKWISYPFKRFIKLNTTEEPKLNNDKILAKVKQLFPHIKIDLNNHVVSLEGSAGSVLDAELDILRQLIVEMKFTIRNEYPTSATTDYERMKSNLESVAKMTSIFNPMKWRWEAQHQVKITVNNIANDACDVTVEGRDTQNQLVKKEFQSFISWLKTCAVLRNPNSGVTPRILKPAIRITCLDIEERISHITDSKRTPIDLWKSLKGSNATRESRMEVVAWIAVCKFDCRVEGGFVRDWVVGNYTARPGPDPSKWITPVAGTPIPYLDKGLIPSDLDCHLPSRKYFDIDKFLDNLHKYQIEYTVVRENWRYVILLDEHAKTGPFTMDLIEPHVVFTQDRIDLDVSNLSLEKDYTKELGMRVDITYKPYSIELEAIVDNIKNKRFQVLRPVDKFVKERVEKMEKRGWTQLGEPIHVIPNPPHNYQAVLVPLPESTELYKTLVTQMKSGIGNQVKVLSILQIRNPSLEDSYLPMKNFIAKQCKGQNPNERELYHGATNKGIDGIFKNGFDDQYWRKGSLGYGAYFSDNANVAHQHSEINTDDQTRTTYYSKVLLGNQLIVHGSNEDPISGATGYHSKHGQSSSVPNNDEYVVYRSGQALPYLRITYKT